MTIFLLRKYGDTMHILLNDLVEIAVSKNLERLSNHLVWLKRGIKKNNGLDWVKDFQDIHALV